MCSGCGAVRILAFFVAGAGLRVSRVRFAWQAQYLVTPASVLGESVWSCVSGRCGPFRGVPPWCAAFTCFEVRILVGARNIACGSWLGRATQRADPGRVAQCSVRILVGARSAACGSRLGRAAWRAGERCSVRIRGGAHRSGRIS